MPSRYRAIFFDLDGTLISERAGVQEARAAVATALRAQGHAVSDAAYASAAAAVIDALLAANGGMWPPVFSRVDAITATLERLSLPTDGAAALSDLHHRTRLEQMTLIPGAAAAVEQARAGHRVGLITNGPGPEQRQKLDRSGLANRFESVTISGEVGAAKPAPAIFERALSSLGVEASAAVYVGNSYAADVVGAQGAGLGAVWLRHSGAPLPAVASEASCTIIESMFELTAALGLDPRREERPR